MPLEWIVISITGLTGILKLYYVVDNST